MRITHTWTDESATIKIEGLAKPVRLLHVTDSHLGLIDDRDAEHMEACGGFREKFGERRKDGNGNNIYAEETFAEVMRDVAGKQVDLLAHTGDLIHFPSQANLEGAAEGLASSGTEFMFTAGNHDWHFSDMPKGTAARDKAWPSLDRLTDGHPSHQARDVGGIRFVAVDDSTYEISEEQLTFLTEQLAAGLPTVLLTHIPLSLPTLRDPTIAVWKRPLLLADPWWGEGAREIQGISPDSAETLEFVRSLSAAPNLVAIFCGHVHFPHVDAISPQAVQYVGPSAFEARQRLVELLPLD